MDSDKAKEGKLRRNREYHKRHKEKLKIKRATKYPELKAAKKIKAEERKKLTGYTTTPAMRRCRRAWYLKQKYGISEETLLQIRTAQGDMCKICGALFKSGTKPHIDHCHTTGIIRGWLCGRCNLGLGMFGDNPTMLRKAAEYLNV